MGVGDMEDGDSLFAELLLERGLTFEQLKRENVIGNVLFHLIREDAALSWSIYGLPPGKKIAVDLYEQPADERVIRTLSLVVLEKLVQIGEAQIVVMANEPARAP